MLFTSGADGLINIHSERDRRGEEFILVYSTNLSIHYLLLVGVGANKKKNIYIYIYTFLSLFIAIQFFYHRINSYYKIVGFRVQNVSLRPGRTLW